MDEMTLTLNSPLTEEQWDMINDFDFGHTKEIMFHTKHGKEIKFIKESARKKGKWIKGKCSECGHHAPYWCFASTYEESSFCPGCGADMRE